MAFCLYLLGCLVPGTNPYTPQPSPHASSWGRQEPELSILPPSGMQATRTHCILGVAGPERAGHSTVLLACRNRAKKALT